LPTNADPAPLTKAKDLHDSFMPVQSWLMELLHSWEKHNTHPSWVKYSIWIWDLFSIGLSLEMLILKVWQEVCSRIRSLYRNRSG